MGGSVGWVKGAGGGRGARCKRLAEQVVASWGMGTATRWPRECHYSTSLSPSTSRVPGAGVLRCHAEPQRLPGMCRGCIPARVAAAGVTVPAEGWALGGVQAQPALPTRTGSSLEPMERSMEPPAVPEEEMMPLSVAPSPAGCQLFGYVGIEAVLDQMKIKTMKTGFEFNIMVVGECLLRGLVSFGVGIFVMPLCQGSSCF